MVTDCLKKDRKKGYASQQTDGEKSKEVKDMLEIMLEMVRDKGERGRKEEGERKKRGRIEGKERGRRGRRESERSLP